MRRMISTVLFIGIMILGFAIYPSSSRARVDVHVGVNLPPLVISAEPELAVIPGTYVYFTPDLGADLFFYEGHWYRPYRGDWYRATYYNGPWVFVEPRGVPYALVHLPHDYRAYSEYRRIPYREVHRNWRTWEREKYWESHNWGRREMERDRHHGVAPRFEGDRHEHGRDYGGHHERDRERH